jgi:hypothetical protein
MRDHVCLLTLFLSFMVITPAVAQTKGKAQPEESRGIVAEEFLKARPGKAGTAAKRVGYRRTGVKSSARKSQTEGGAQLGLTVWRLRPARANDEVRMIVQQGEGELEWTPERVATDAPLRLGERIRFSFESPREGYLYVIDRERYANGSFGEPTLIFPTTRTRGGDNRVAPGRIVEIPAQEDRPNYMWLKPTRLDLVGENLLVLVTPQPLEGITIGDKPLPLSEEQVTKWEKSWGAAVEKFEMAGGAGKTWTRAEKEAGADATRALTQEDPGPQTIYRTAAKSDQPILIKVGLRYGRSSARQKN